jgi:lipoyl(octanoyl) transferase
LADHGVTAQGDPAARGVYVRGKKIAALGLKVSRGRSYHGLSLNVDMDLSPFAGINPCGHKGLEVTSVQQELGADQPINFSDIGERLLHHLGQVLPSQT